MDVAYSRQEPQFDPALKELLLRATGHHLGEGGGTPELAKLIPVVVRLTSPDVNIPGVEAVARMGDIVTARVALGDIVELRQHRYVSSLKASAGISGDLLHSVSEIHASSQQLPHIQRQSPFTGKGTMIGIVDWGIDPVHEAFRNTSGHSRLHAIWDQRGGPSPTSPQPYGYGRLIRREQIDNALHTTDPYRSLDYDPATIDLRAQGTHGTHVASIATGSGRLPGVAPEADVIFVHLGGSDTRPEDTLGDSVRVLEAVDFILREAGNTPVSINLSLGRTGDAKDGTSPVERALDAALKAKPGRAISMSTGNYFSARLHAEGKLNGSPHTLNWLLPGQRRDSAEMEIWYAGADTFEVSLINPDGHRIMTVPLGESAVARQHPNASPLISCYHRRHDPNNGENLINLFLHAEARSGSWQVRLVPKQISNGYFHAWIERGDTRSQSRFHPADTSPSCTIGTICCGHHTIACGAYKPQDPDRRLGDYSSAGPSRDLRQIPVVSAPGDRIVAARSSSPDILGRNLHGYCEKSGTSMASPHCTGVVALMMQAALPQRLSIDEVRQILTQTARRPPINKSFDELRYGAGLLDAKAAVTEVLRRYHPLRQLAPPNSSAHEESAMETNNDLALLLPEHENLPATSQVAGGHQIYNWLAGEDVDYRESRPVNNAAIYEWLDGDDASALGEYANPTLVRNRLSMEWRDLNLVTGGDGQPHLYYLTSGDPDRGRATFRVRIRNTTSAYMRNATIKWRFSSRQTDGTYRTVRLNGQAEGQAYLASGAPNLRANQEAMRTLLISRQILEGAYDSDSPLCRMEVEYHWYEGRTPYYTRRSLSFYLFRPVEFLFGSARNDDDVSLRDSRYRSDFWMPIRGKEFSEHDRQPVNVSLTITTGLSSSTSQQQSMGSRMTASASVTHGQSTTVGTETGASLSIGIDKVLEAGVESSMSTSQTQSIQWSRSMAQEFSRQIVHSRSFSSSYTRTQQVSWTIQASDAGTVRTLFAYPVFNRKRVRVVNFGRANANGQASRRRVINNFPVLLFSRWVDTSTVTPVNRRESVEGSPTQPLQAIQAPAPIDEGAENLQRLPRLRTNQVTHLALEGGGGKGIVYLGAIEALEQLNVLRYHQGRVTGIQGISGSSAGAITALALSLGMNHQSLLRLFKGPSSVQFNEFFDLPAEPRKVPRLGSSCVNNTANSVVDRYMFNILQQTIRHGLDSVIPDSVSRLSSRLDPEQLADALVRYLRQELHRHTVDQRLRNRGAEDKLMSSALLYYLINLVEDFGFFSGCRARVFLDGLIAQRSGGKRNMTFVQHRSRFQTRLVITGSNLETGRTEFFSSDTTPHMAVADAVRISMGLPFVYKPVRITAAESRRITGGNTNFRGLWVDGGVWNNLPLRAFGTPSPRNGTLGIRLGIPQRVTINSFMDFLKRYLIDFGVLGSGETNQSGSSGLMSRVITLDTGNLDTTQFSPPASVVDPLIERAKQVTLSYFR